MPAPETHRAVAALPFQRLVAGACVDVMRGRPFELLNQIGETHEWLVLHCQMHVRVGPAELVQEDALHLARFLSQERMREILRCSHSTG